MKVRQTVTLQKAGSDATACCLLSVADSAGFADDVDLDLTRILEFIFDLLADISCKSGHRVILDLLGLDHDTDLSTRLDRVRGFDALEGGRDLFELLQTLDVILQILAARAGTSR